MIDKQIRKNPRHKSRQPLSELVRKSILALLVSLSFINAFLLILYLVNNNDNSQKGYSLKASQELNDELQIQQKKLESQLIELQRLDQIRANDLILEMEPATEEIFQIVE